MVGKAAVAGFRLFASEQAVLETFFEDFRRQDPIVRK